MRPIDCLPQDWGFYYNSGFMMHEGRPVQVVVDEDRHGEPIMLVKTTRQGRARRVDPGSLIPYYPESRSVQHESHAYYIARRARQSRRRTANVEHYYVAWGSIHFGPQLPNRLMWALATDHKYLSLEQAQRGFRTSKLTAAALSEELIVLPGPEEIGDETTLQVIWCGREVGIVVDGVFYPTQEEGCFTKLARKSIEELKLEWL